MCAPAAAVGEDIDVAGLVVSGMVANRGSTWINMDQRASS